MIISYAHNFIFIKTRKTAGSSMEVALATHAAPDDIVTPLGLAQELERYQIYPQAVPRNFVSDKGAEGAFVRAIQSGDKRALKEVYRKDIRSSRKLSVQRHGGAAAAKRAAGEGFWQKAYKFTIERHPYEKAVSLAWFERHGRDFSEVLEEVLTGRRYRNFDLYTLDGKLAVDFVIRYEKLAEDTQQVERTLGGLEILARLPKSNSGQRKDSRSAQQVLTEKQKAIVQETCREEFELFGYER